MGTDTIAPPPAKPRAVVGLPTAGRLLVQDARGLVVIRQDGGRTKLPAADGATWSPHGLFIAAWTGNELRAMEPDGDPRWRITTKQPIRNAVWSPTACGSRTSRAIASTSSRATAPTTTRWSAGPREKRTSNGTPSARRSSRTVGASSAMSEPGGRCGAAGANDRATIDGNTLRVNGRALLTVRGLGGMPVWSPDGRYLAIGRGRSILLTSADGTRLSTIAGGVPLGWAPLARP